MTLQLVAKLQTGKVAMPDGMQVTLISRPLTLVEWREAGKQAATMLQALEAENLRLREAVESLEARATLAAGVLGNGGPKFRHVQISFDILANIARAALSSEPKQEQGE